jgi:hypothetical protein
MYRLCEDTGSISSWFRPWLSVPSLSDTSYSCLKMTIQLMFDSMGNKLIERNFDGVVLKLFRWYPDTDQRCTVQLTFLAKKGKKDYFN